MSAGGAPFAAPVPANGVIFFKMQLGPRGGAYSMNRTPENGIDAVSSAPISWLRNRHLCWISYLQIPAPHHGECNATSSPPPSNSVLRSALLKSRTPLNSRNTSSRSTFRTSRSPALCQGHAAAWDYFVSTFRAYLRSAAAAILRCPPESPAARELADSLFADLYGLSDAPQSSLPLPLFHGVAP